MRFLPVRSVLSLAVAVSGFSMVGCSTGGHDHDYRASGYDRRYNDDDARSAAGRNTRIADIEDDGRRNGSARSYEERKASRAADEGDRSAARREDELRREREYGR